MPREGRCCFQSGSNFVPAVDKEAEATHAGPDRLCNARACSLRQRAHCLRLDTKWWEPSGAAGRCGSALAAGAGARGDSWAAENDRHRDCVRCPLLSEASRGRVLRWLSDFRDLEGLTLKLWRSAVHRPASIRVDRV